MKKNVFNSIQLMKPNRNRFDLSHDFKFSCNMGNLVPTLVMEAMPGDKFEISAQSLIRFAPMIAPVMHRMDVTHHYFFVPSRLLWDNFEKWINDPNSGIACPVFSVNNATIGPSSPEAKFLDYMGLPPNNTAIPMVVNGLPLAAYQCIYNEYYRDQNLITPVDYKLIDGENVTVNPNWFQFFQMRKRAWQHDYFTASLPFAQKGAAVDVPLGSLATDAEVYHKDVAQPSTTLTGAPLNANVDTRTPGNIIGGDLFANTEGLEIEPTTINQLRWAVRLQEWLEKNARAGTRYIETILAHFGVKSSDARLQRPEYITGVKTPVVVSEVLNTTGEDAGLPQGNMAGHAIAVNTGKSGSYFCEEHGYIMCITSVMPLPAYQQGIPKHYLKKDPLDYPWPTFANLGEQEVQLQELYAHTAANEDTFGYVPRYSDLKYMPSRVAGDFRTTLNYWHLGRIFATAPALNQQFIECDPASTQRIFAVDDPAVDKLYCHILHQIDALRPLPVYGTPTI